MKISKSHNYFDEIDDSNLRESILKSHNCFDEEQYIFSKRLCEELIKQKKTNIDLAELADVSKSAITNYTKGYRMPTPKQLQRISFALGVTTDFLLGKTSSDNIEIAEIEDMLGLYENTMRVLYLLNHNVEEVQDLRDKNPLSNENKNKLNILNLFIQNKNFIKLLCYFERYVDVKQKLENTNFEEGMFNKETKESIENDLVGIQGIIIRLLFNDLDNITTIHRKE